MKSEWLVVNGQTVHGPYPTHQEAVDVAKNLADRPGTWTVCRVELKIEVPNVIDCSGMSSDQWDEMLSRR